MPSMVSHVASFASFVSRGSESEVASCTSAGRTSPGSRHGGSRQIRRQGSMISERGAGRPSFIRGTTHSSEKLLPAQDVFTWMSAQMSTEHVEVKSHAADSHQGLSLPPSYPLPLIFFVSVLSVIGGLVVKCVHYAILFAGCPLGINGCNSFTSSKEKYGFFLVDALKESIPEDFIYIIAAMAGGLFFSQLCTRVPEHLAFQISGGGTVQSLVAVASGVRIPLKAAALRVLTTSIYLGTGGTLGMDGPAIQVCTAVAAFCGSILGMKSVQTQSLLASIGFAAGFAASFNAPMAGIMFAMEELSHVSSVVSRHIICIIVMVSIVATAIARLFSGNDNLLQADWSEELKEDVSGGSLDKVFGKHMWMLIAIPIAIVCSLFGCLAAKLMQKLSSWTVHSDYKMPFTMLVLTATLITSSIGSAVFRITGLRGVWGIGYESLQRAFDTKFNVYDYYVFAVGKMLAAIVSITVRAPGDILEPVLITGAFLGGGIGRALQGATEDDYFNHDIMQPCVVFGMVAFFASCFRFPLTPVVIVLEMAGIDTYALILPSALAAFTAVIVSNKLFVPLLDIVMHEDGVSLHDVSEGTEASEDLEAGESDNEPEPEESELSSNSSTKSCASHHSRQSSLVLVNAMVRGVEDSMLALAMPKACPQQHNNRTRNISIMSHQSKTNSEVTPRKGHDDWASESRCTLDMLHEDRSGKSPPGSKRHSRSGIGDAERIHGLRRHSQCHSHMTSPPESRQTSRANSKHSSDFRNGDLSLRNISNGCEPRLNMLLQSMRHDSDKANKGHKQDSRRSSFEKNRENWATASNDFVSVSIQSTNAAAVTRSTSDSSPSPSRGSPTRHTTPSVTPPHVLSSPEATIATIPSVMGCTTGSMESNREGDRCRDMNMEAEATKLVDSLSDTTILSARTSPMSSRRASGMHKLPSGEVTESEGRLSPPTSDLQVGDLVPVREQPHVVTPDVASSSSFFSVRVGSFCPAQSKGDGRLSITTERRLAPPAVETQEPPSQPSTMNSIPAMRAADLFEDSTRRGNSLDGQQGTGSDRLATKD